MSKSIKHREEWLYSSVQLMQPVFARLNKKIARLLPELQNIHKRLGNPHSKLDKTAIQKEKKPSTTVKVECSCGYKITIAKKLVAEYGLPTCVCGEPFVSEESENEND